MINGIDKIIFVYPYEQISSANKASRIRPYKMEQAFKAVLGNKVLISCGKKRFKNISVHEQYKGLYLESINRPFFIQRILEKDWKIFSDYWHLWKLKRKGVRLSVFYRDGFWAGSFLEEQYSYPLSKFLKWSYQVEWFVFKKLFDNIYLPSLELLDYIGEQKSDRYKLLLPGCFITQTFTPVSKSSGNEQQEQLTFIYSGGINPPLNDITLMLKLLGNRESIRLIILTRKEEWEKYQENYNFSYSNIEVILEQSTGQLQQYYAFADASLMLYPAHPYRYLAMPFKAFEAMSYGLPLLSFSDCIMGNFIKNNHLGLALSYKQFEQQLLDLSDLSNNLKYHRKQVLKYAKANLWDDRVKQVVNDFNYEIKKS